MDHVTLSTKESQKMKLLETKLAEIDILLKQNINNMGKVLATTQQTDTEIENIFKTFRNKLNERERLLRHKLNDESNKQLNQLQQQQKHLTSTIHTIKNGLIQQNSIALDPKLNAMKRETEISNITNNTLNNIQNDDIKFEMQPISFVLNENEINQYISSIGVMNVKRIPVKVSEPELLTLPITQMKYATLDDTTKKIKLGFKLTYEAQNKHIDIINKCLKIHVSCRLDLSDDEQVGQVIHEEAIPLNDCKLNPRGTGRYELYVNKIFDAGIVVEFRIKAIFISADYTKYVSSEGKWSRAMTYGIPEPDLKFHIEFENESREAVMSCFGYDSVTSFGNRFLDIFSKSLKANEKLMLTTDGKEISDPLKKYVSKITPKNHQLLVCGYIHELKFNDLNILNDVINIILLYEDDKFVIKGEIVLQPIKKKRQMSIITIFNGVKKRIVMKNRPEKNQYEYTMDFLKPRCVRKFESKGLQEPFELMIDTGQKVETDDDIITYLSEYNGEVEITQL